MHKRDMNQKQHRDWKVFNLILECYGWEDVDDTEARLDAGEFVKPEGLRERRETYTHLEIKLHTPVNMISLRVTDRSSEDFVQIHFLYANEPERVLEYIVDYSEKLDLENYSDLIEVVGKSCEMVLLEKADMEIYEVKPSV